jgi:hypothetical protein
MKKIFLLLVLCVFLISITTAIAEDNLVFKKGDIIDLKIPCVKENTKCGESATCVITILYPNSSIAIENGDMNNLGNGYFNYTLSQTNIIGQYQSTVFCAESEFKGSETFVFWITPTGLENNTTIFLILIFASIFLLLIAFIFKNTIFAFISGLTFMSTGLYSMIYGFGDVANTYTYILSLIIIGFGMLLTIMSSLDFINENSSQESSEEE